MSGANRSEPEPDPNLDGPSRNDSSRNDSNLRWVRAGRHKIRCSISGGSDESEERPLLLVNGLGAGLERWDGFRRALGEDRRTIAFDAPGTGGSSTPLRPPTMRQLADIGLTVAHELGADEIDVLGYSFGGSVAQEMAVAMPDRVRRLVLVAASCGWGAIPGDLMGMATATTRSLHMSRRTDPMGLWWQLAAISVWSSRRWLGSIKQPTLVVVGDSDRVTPVSTAKQLTRGIPDARLAVVDGADHWVLLGEDVTRAASIVNDFLDDAQLSAGLVAEDSLAAT